MQSVYEYLQTNPLIATQLVRKQSSDYIDEFSVSDLNGKNIGFGIDEDDRCFIALTGKISLEDGTTENWGMTLFQRYSDDPRFWTSARLFSFDENQELFVTGYYSINPTRAAFLLDLIKNGKRDIKSDDKLDVLNFRSEKIIKSVFF